MNTTESKSQERTRLLTDFHNVNAWMKAAVRQEDWDKVEAMARECSRLAHLLELNKEGGE